MAIEPSNIFGRSYLEAIRSVVDALNKQNKTTFIDSKSKAGLDEYVDIWDSYLY